MTPEVGEMLPVNLPRRPRRRAGCSRGLMERETAEVNKGEGVRVSDPISLTLPSSPEYVLLARLVVAQVGRLAGFGPEDVYDLKRAVEITVIDTGGGFNVADLMRVPDGQGGFGLAVIRDLVDELVLDSTEGGGTRLKMIRRATPL